MKELSYGAEPWGNHAMAKWSPPQLMSFTGECLDEQISAAVCWAATMKIFWSTLTGLTKVAYSKAGKTNPGFRDEGRDRVPAIVKINKAGKRLACKFNAYGT